MTEKNQEIRNIHKEDSFRFGVEEDYEEREEKRHFPFIVLRDRKYLKLIGEEMIAQRRNQRVCLKNHQRRLRSTRRM